MSTVATAVQAVCVGYVLLAHAVTLALVLRAVPVLRRGRGFIRDSALPPVHPDFMPPFSLVVVARDEEGSIIERVAPLLALDYPEYEVIVVNDGSNDGTLAALESAFHLGVFPEAHWRRLPSAPVRAIYRSPDQPHLRVVDQARRGDADALNGGINASRFPLLCVVQAGATLRRDALQRLAEPFLEDPHAIAACSPAARVGAVVRWWRHDAVLRDLRELLCDMGRATSGPVLVAPRGVVAFRKETVIEARGYRGEAADMGVDLLGRMQRVLRDRRLPARVAFVAETICHIAQDEAGRAGHRVLQQQALVETLHRHGWALAGGALAKLALALDAYRPLLAPLAFAAMALTWLTGGMPGKAFAAFVMMVYALGVLASALALAIEAAYFERLAAETSLGPLCAVAVLEGAGLRQAAWIVQLRGVVRAFRPKTA